MNDLRFAFRQLLKNPGFTAVAVLTLALGIGATSTVFSLIQGVLLTPPPYPKPERVLLISPARTDGQPYMQGCAAGQWVEWQKATNSFEAVAAYEYGSQFLILPDGSESVRGMFVTPDYFKVIGVKPVLGRGFAQSDLASTGGQETVIVLGDRLWHRRFDGDPNIIGKTVHLTRRQPLTVVGVMPPGVRLLPSRTRATEPNYDVNAQVDFWIPLWPPDLAKPNEAYCNVAGRLRDNATLTQAQAEMTAIAARQAQNTHDFEDITATVQPLTAFLNREGRRLLLPLLGAVTLVFLIACGNVAGLLLARGLRRRQEYAVRCALGARRAQLFRQVFTESALLALAGGALGAGLAFGIVKLLKAIGGSAIPRLDAVSTGGPVFFCFGAAVLAAALAGFLPALRVSRLDPALSVKGAGPTSSPGRAERRLLGGVAVLQITLTLALLVGAGLLIRTAYNLARVRPGYDTQNVLTMSVTIPDMKKFSDFHSQVLPRVSALPGAKSVAMGWGLPLTGNKWTGPVEIEKPAETGKLKEKLNLPIRCVTAEYFETLGLRIVAGRGFLPTDAWDGPAANTNAPFVATINQAMAERFFPNENPVGKKLIIFSNKDKPAEIVGVVDNARSEALIKEAEPEVYLPFWQFGFGLFVKHLVIRTASDPHLLVAAVERELRAIDPTVAIEHVKTLEEIRRESVAPQSFVMRLLVGFSIVASALVLVGVYSVISLSVGSRSREIAIRMAVGAQRRNVLGLVLREGCKLIVVGLIVGTGVAVALARLLGAFLFGVEPTDPATFVGVAILFTTIALLACYLPARRAAKIDPMEALRYE